MSEDIVTLTPDSTVDELAAVMRDRAVRRIPVLEGDVPVGIVSIGDLAIIEDPDSAFADVSKTRPNT
jgi:CBS domain-containing protein